MQALIRSKSAGITGGRGTAGAGPGMDLLYCVTAAWRDAGWQPCVDASGGAPGCGAGSPVGPGAGLICGYVVPRGFSGQVPTAAVFVGSRQVTPGAPGSLWLRGVVAGVVAPPVWMDDLVGGCVACRPPMVPDRP